MFLRNLSPYPRAAFHSDIPLELPAFQIPLVIYTPFSANQFRHYIIDITVTNQIPSGGYHMITE